MYLSSIVALTTSYIRVLKFCGQVPFLCVIIVGFVVAGQARLSHAQKIMEHRRSWNTSFSPFQVRCAAACRADDIAALAKKMVSTAAHTHHLSHAASFTRNFVTHIQLHRYICTYVHTYIHTYIPFYLLDLSPPPLSFLPSLSPLKPLKLIIGRS